MLSVPKVCGLTDEELRDLVVAGRNNEFAVGQ